MESIFFSCLQFLLSSDKMILVSEYRNTVLVSYNFEKISSPPFPISTVELRSSLVGQIGDNWEMPFS
jgi:hypothetical protein